MPPNWDVINRCSLWKVLGVTECDNCDSCTRCWGEETSLPERNGIESLEVLLSKEREGRASIGFEPD